VICRLAALDCPDCLARPCQDGRQPHPRRRATLARRTGGGSMCPPAPPSRDDPAQPRT